MNSINDQRWNNWKYLLPLSEGSNVLVLGENCYEIATAVSEFVCSVSVVRAVGDHSVPEKDTPSVEEIDNINIVDGFSACLSSVPFQGIILGPDQRGECLLQAQEIASRLPMVFVALMVKFSIGAFLNRVDFFKNYLSSFLESFNCRSVRKYTMLPNFMDWRIITPLNHRRSTKKSFQLYNNITLRQRTIKTIFSSAAEMGIMPHLAPNFLLIINKENNFGLPVVTQAIKDTWGMADFEVAVRRCSAGRGNKAILQVMEPNGKIRGFIKITGSANRMKYLKNEFEILQKLDRFNFRYFSIPKVKGYFTNQNQCLLLIDAKDKTRNAVELNISAEIVRCLVELNLNTRRYAMLDESKFLKHCLSLIQKERDSSIQSFAKEAINIAHLGLKGISIPFGMAHRDFVAWNIREDTKRLFIIDWEFAVEEHIPCMDFFHFVIQGRLHNTSKDISTILKKSFFQNNRVSDLFKLYCQQINLEPNLGYYFLLLYLVDWSLFERSIVFPKEAKALEYANMLHSMLNSEDFSARSWRHIYTS